jgi:hypothetical protein
MDDVSAGASSLVETSAQSVASNPSEHNLGSSLTVPTAQEAENESLVGRLGVRLWLNPKCTSSCHGKYRNLGTLAFNQNSG